MMAIGGAHGYQTYKIDKGKILQWMNIHLIQ